MRTLLTQNTLLIVQHTHCTVASPRRQQDRRRGRNGSRQRLCQWLPGAVAGQFTPHTTVLSPSTLGMCTLLTHTRRSMCDTPTVQLLYLNDNQISDAGLTALANACASGSLASITNIYLQNNKATQVGKEAMRDVAKARGFRVTV